MRNTKNFVNYDLDVTPLYKAIESENWDLAKKCCIAKPKDVRTWIFKENTDEKSIRWCVLPIHQACARHCPKDLMVHLIKMYPSGVRKNSFQNTIEQRAPKNVHEIDYSEGNLPIHFATEWGVQKEVISMLLKSYPESVTVRDRRGLTPTAILRKVKYANKDEIIAEFARFESNHRMEKMECQVEKLSCELEEAPYCNAGACSDFSEEGFNLSHASKEELRARVVKLNSENSNLRQLTQGLHEKIFSLENSLSFMISIQKRIVRMATTQENEMTDIAKNIRGGTDYLQYKNERE